MSKEFTDGPWHYGGDHTDVSGDVLYVGEITAGGSNYRGEIARVQSCDHIPNGISRDEAKANIRLIAAAPDLLEALDDLLIAYCDPGNQGGDHDEKVEAARAAIAKARGTTC